MIKVLVIETTTFGYDGITNVICNYYLYQDHSQVKMDLLTIDPVSEKIKTELNKNSDKNYVLSYRNRNPIKYIWNVRKILKKGGYEIVHVHGNSATMTLEMLAALLAGVKVRIAHSHNTTCDHIKIDKILRPFFRSWYTNGFACGKEAGEWLFPGKSFDVINNGIDLKKFQYNEDVRSSFRRKYDLCNNYVVGHVGRFSEQKNHKKLIAIFEKLCKIRPDAKLVLIGDGELKSEIEDIVHKKNLNVLFVGVSDEVECWLQAMDVMVLPSLFEGLPLGIVEAQASGLPCILSDTVSPMTKITDIVKFVILNSDNMEWAQIINDIDGKFDRSARMDLIENQIKDAHFDIHTNCKELVEKYNELIRNRRA